MIAKSLISVALIICSNLLIINHLSAQSQPIKEYKMVGKDSMKYAINEQGDTIFSGVIKGENLRLVNDGRSNRIYSTNRVMIYEETYPEYPNGIGELFRFLGNNIRYPKIARENGAQGTVYVGFVIDIDGSLVDINVKSIKKIFSAKSEAKQRKEEKKIPIESYQAMEEEAIRVVKLMPKWKPGTQQSKQVRVSYTLPIKFKLE